MKKIAIAILFVSGLSACTTPVTPEAASPAEEVFLRDMTQPSNGSSSITMTRDAGLFGSACSLHFSVDGKDVARLNPKQTITVYVPPGHHNVATFSVDACGAARTDLGIETHDGKRTLLTTGEAADGLALRFMGEGAI